MISPSRSPRAAKLQKPVRGQLQQQQQGQQQQQQEEEVHFCSNESHPHKRAEYYIHIEEEDMFYCGVCATQAASQGFTVNKMGDSKKVGESKKMKCLPHHPQYAGNQRYGKITELMKKINLL